MDPELWLDLISAATLKLLKTAESPRDYNYIGLLIQPRSHYSVYWQFFWDHDKAFWYRTFWDSDKSSKLPGIVKDIVSAVNKQSGIVPKRSIASIISYSVDFCDTRIQPPQVDSFDPPYYMLTIAIDESCKGVYHFNNPTEIEEYGELIGAFMQKQEIAFL